MTLKITKQQLENIIEHYRESQNDWLDEVDLNGVSFKVGNFDAEATFDDDEGMHFAKIIFHPKFARDYRLKSIIFEDLEHFYNEETNDFALDENAKKEDIKSFYIDLYKHGEEIFSLSGQGIQCRFDTSRYVGLLEIKKADFLKLFTEEQWNDNNFIEMEAKSFMEWFNSIWSGYTVFLLDTDEDRHSLTSSISKNAEKEIAEAFEVVEVSKSITKMQKRVLGDEVKYTNLSTLLRYLSDCLEDTGFNVESEIKALSKAMDKVALVDAEFLTLIHKECLYSDYIIQSLKMNQIKFLIDDILLWRI